MTQPYTWRRISQAEGSAMISARSGHTLTQTKSGIICYGGTDGRKNDRGSSVPNSDLYILSLTENTYSWTHAIPKDKNLWKLPPSRVNHAAVAVDSLKVCVFRTRSMMHNRCLCLVDSIRFHRTNH